MLTKDHGETTKTLKRGVRSRFLLLDAGEAACDILQVGFELSLIYK
jgi:hypothetical protein